MFKSRDSLSDLAELSEPTPEHDSKKKTPTVAWDLALSKIDLGQGWTKGAASLRPSEQPRARTGEPMRHLMTVLVPREYRVAGVSLVGLALFQAPVREPASDVEVARAHAYEHRMRDAIGGEFALVWLSAQELARGPQRGGRAPRWLALRPRAGDPLVGKVLRRVAPDRASMDHFASNHFGGTPTSKVAKLSPWYLEIEETFVGASLAGTSARVVLDAPAIFWGED